MYEKNIISLYALGKYSTITQITFQTRQSLKNPLNIMVSIIYPCLISRMKHQMYL